MFSKNNSPKSFRSSIVSTSFKQFVTKRKFAFYRNSNHQTSRNKTIQVAKSHHHQIYQTQMYLANKREIKKLKYILQSLQNRKDNIENPEYQIFLQKDISVWKLAIQEAREELQIIRQGERQKLKQRRQVYRKYQQMYTSLKELMRYKNSLEQYLADVQKQLTYYGELQAESEDKIKFLEGTIPQFFKQKSNQYQLHLKQNNDLRQMFQKRIQQKQTLQRLLERYDQYTQRVNNSLQTASNTIRCLKSQCQTADECG